MFTCLCVCVRALARAFVRVSAELVLESREAIRAAFWSILGACWCIWGPSWSVWGLPGTFLEHVGARRGLLAPSRELLWASLTPLGEHLGPIWGHLGLPLAPDCGSGSGCTDFSKIVLALWRQHDFRGSRGSKIGTEGSNIGHRSAESAVQDGFGSPMRRRRRLGSDSGALWAPQGRHRGFMGAGRRMSRRITAQIGDRDFSRNNTDSGGIGVITAAAARFAKVPFCDPV